MSQAEIGPVFIFASGQRCGSTLLQRFLTSHPDVMIWGEHDGILETIFEQFDRFNDWETMFGHMFRVFVDKGVNNFIPNMNPPKAVIRQAQINLMLNMWRDPALAMDRHIWGFKEVLYDARFALRLKELFPNAKLIHLTRNIFECFISLIHEENFGIQQPYLPIEEVWNRDRTKGFIRCWTEVNRSFVENPALQAADWVFSLKYEDLVGDTQATTQRLIHWLGLDPADFDYSVFKVKLYTDRPGENDGGEDRRPPLTRADLSPDDVALVTTDEILQVSRKLGFDMRIDGAPPRSMSESNELI